MDEYVLLVNYLNRKKDDINNELEVNNDDTKLLFNLKNFIDKYSSDVRSINLNELKNILSEIELNDSLVSSFIW